MRPVSPIQTFSSQVPAARVPAAPREHGAWLMLLIPYISGIGIQSKLVTGTIALRLCLLFMASLCAFVGTRNLEVQIRRKATLKSMPGVPLLLSLAAGSFIGVLLIGPDAGISQLAGIVLPLIGFRLALQWRVGKGRPDRTIGGEIFAASILTSTGPAAIAVCEGRLSAQACWLWALSFIYFSCGIVYVKMWLRAASCKRDWDSNIRRQCAAPNLTAASVLALCCFLPAFARCPVPGLYWSTLAFVPGTVRSIAGCVLLKPRLPNLKRVGLAEAALSVLFMVAAVPLIQLIGGGK